MNKQDDLSELIGDSRYMPFLHRLTESTLSYVVKVAANFVIAIFQVFNIPAAFLLFIFFIEQLIQKFWPSWNFSITYNFEMIATVFGTWLLLQFLVEKTKRNLVSPTVFPIWFMNTKGVMKNNFFSAELSKKYSADLEQFVRYQADEYINEELRAKQQEIDKLITAIELLREFNTFPNESFESMRRVVELLADIVVEPSNSRHQFEVILDRILVEISSMKIIQQHIRQGSIMLLNERSELKIIGQYNMPNSVVRNKKVLLGEKFAGKVAQSGEVVWIESVNTPGAEIEYGFESNNNRPYDGIMGFPIRESGIENYRPVGVIILHFAKGFQPEQDQMTAVSKVLEVYAQLIISSIKIQNYQMKLRNKYGIIGVEEEVSTTFYSGGDTE